jgi:hypothetical protein
MIRVESMLDRVLFSDHAPWIALGLALLAFACAWVPFIRSRKPLRNLLYGACVALFIASLALNKLPYFYAAGGSEDTLAIGLEDDVVVVADRREVRDLLPRSADDTFQSADDVLRLHVIDASEGTLVCRAIVGLQGRLLDVVDGHAWVAAAGFGSDSRWSYRSIRRMSVRDCSVEDVLEPGWRDELADVGLGIKEIQYIGQASLLIASNDGSMHHFDITTRARRDLEPEEVTAYQQIEPKVSRPGGEGSMGTFRTQPSGGGANFLKIGQLNEDGKSWRQRHVSERVYVRPRFLARSSAQGRTLMTHRDGENGPWILTALDEDGAHAWDLSEEAAFGKGLPRRPAGVTPFAVTDATGCIVASHGNVVKLGWDGSVVWRLRL